MPKKVNLQLTGPALAIDGNAVQVNEKSGEVNLIFFQVVAEDKDEVRANSVANIRLNLDELKMLGVTINDVLQKNSQRKSED